MDRAAQIFIADYLADSLDAMRAFAGDGAIRETLSDFAGVIAEALSNGGKLMIAGNGGSAADAQHIAAELVSRLFSERAPLPAMALTTDTSILTAVGNDYGYDHVFERQVLGLGRKGDVFLGISTSGKSPSVLLALEAARSKGIVTLGFGGAGTSPMSERCDRILRAPSNKTSIIQQLHIVAAHLICGLVERRLFGP